MVLRIQMNRSNGTLNSFAINYIKVIFATTNQTTELDQSGLQQHNWVFKIFVFKSSTLHSWSVFVIPILYEILCYMLTHSRTWHLQNSDYGIIQLKIQGYYLLKVLHLSPHTIQKSSILLIIEALCVCRIFQCQTESFRSVFQRVRDTTFFPYRFMKIVCLKNYILQKFGVIRDFHI